jgi:hypothetical protein
VSSVTVLFYSIIYDGTFSPECLSRNLVVKRVRRLSLPDILYVQFLRTILDMSTSHLVSKPLYPVLESKQNVIVLDFGR